MRCGELEQQLRDYKACGATYFAIYTSNLSRSFNDCKRHFIQNKAMRVYFHRLSMRLLILCLLCMVTTEANKCDPKNPRSCRYMGKCVDMRTLPQFNPKLNTSADEKYYICKCPAINCYDLEKDVICAEDAGVQK